MSPMTFTGQKLMAIVKLETASYKSLQEMQQGEMARRSKKRALELGALILETEEPGFFPFYVLTRDNSGIMDS